MATYWEKLRDPCWQKKRLEIMERAEVYRKRIARLAEARKPCTV